MSNEIRLNANKAVICVFMMYCHCSAASNTLIIVPDNICLTET